MLSGGFALGIWAVVLAGAVDYEADASCPATLGVPLDRNDVAVNVRVHTSTRGHTGVLRMETPGRAPMTRTVEGQTCNEVVEALALITTLATRHLPRPTPIRSPTAVTTPRTTVARAPFDIAAGAHASVTSGLTEHIVVAAPLFIDARLGDLSARLLFQWAVTSVDAAPGRADVRRWGGRLDVCPFRLGPDHLFVTACGSFELGMITATGEALVGARTARAAWLAPGGALRGAIDLTDRVFLEAELASAVPLLRPRVVVDRTRVVSEARTTFSASLGGGVRIF